MKQTFEIPEGCKVVTVEQIGNQLITSFEPKKYEPKVGDCVKLEYGKGSYVYCLISETCDTRIHSKNTWVDEYPHESLVKFGDFGASRYSSIEKITPEEFQAEFDKLGYVYDFETHTAHKKRWRAGHGKNYFFVTGAFEIEQFHDIGNWLNDLHYKAGNYFKNKEDAEPYRDYMLQHSLNFHKK